MNTFKQIGAVTAMNLRSLPQRLGTSLVIVIGIAGVVAVLVSVLAMSAGMVKSMRGAGRDDRAMVMRNGASNEMSSNLTREAVAVISDAPGVKRDADGKAIYSSETMTIILLTKKDGTDVSIPLRGVGPNANALRPEIKILEGRMFEPGLNEVIVGKGARAQYSNVELGSELTVRSTVWKIVGVFDSGGDIHESELMTHNVALQNAMRRGGGAQSVTVMLDSPAAFATFKDALTSNPELAVDVASEREYFAQQSSRIAPMLSVVAYVIGGIMAIGATFGALNTMYSAVSTRAVEIATLRALGFGATPIVISVLVEAMLLSLLGGAIGAFLGWLFFNGHTVSSAAGGVAGESRIFNLYVSPTLIVIGISLACFIGFIGGLFPSIRAARLPVATALRAN
ncbi:MAG: ABC transporter permease [Candidatus Obscuribacterales bacterium]|nr:ABC transporter permease [Steroidobacteraceae bacterium]